MGRRQMGFHHLGRQQLASADLAFPHAGLRVVRYECRGASSGQRLVPHGQRGAAFPVAVPDDRPSRQQLSPLVVFVATTWYWKQNDCGKRFGPAGGCALAGRICGGAICLASIARGVGRLGGGTERRVEHVLRAAVAPLLRKGSDKWQVAGNRDEKSQTRASLVAGHILLVTFLLPGLDFLCLRFDGQADAGDIALRVSAAGLLAVGKSPKQRIPGFESFVFDFGKVAVLFAHRNFVCGNVSGPAG